MLDAGKQPESDGVCFFRVDFFCPSALRLGYCGCTARMTDALRSWCVSIACCDSYFWQQGRRRPVGSARDGDALQAANKAR